MTLTCEAVFEDGVFRPTALLPGGLTEGQQVHLVVEAAATGGALSLAADVYKGLTEEEINGIERIAMDRTRFFGGGTP